MKRFPNNGYGSFEVIGDHTVILGDYAQMIPEKVTTKLVPEELEELRITCEHYAGNHDYRAVRDTAREIIGMIDAGKSKEEIEAYIRSVLAMPWVGSHSDAVNHVCSLLLVEFFSLESEEVQA